MATKKHNKLVRDFIPAIIRRNGDEEKHRILELVEHKQMLLKKILEEWKEASAAKTPEKMLLELVDIQQAIDDLVELHGVPRKDFRATLVAKRKSNGGFKRGVFLIETRSPKKKRGRR